MSLVDSVDRLTEAIGGSPPPRLLFRIGVATEQASTIQPTPQFQSNRKGEIMAIVEITATQDVPLSVAFKDRKGNPAPVDGTPEWMIDNPNLVALTPAADGMSCVASAVGPLGSALVSLKADADRGDGMKEVIGTLQIDITGGEANVVEIVPGTPSEQP